MKESLDRLILIMTSCQMQLCDSLFNHCQQFRLLRMTCIFSILDLSYFTNSRLHKSIIQYTKTKDGKQTWKLSTHVLSHQACIHILIAVLHFVYNSFLSLICNGSITVFHFYSSILQGNRN